MQPTPDITWTGTGLQRPECVLATAGGTLFASDKRGGVMRIARDGTQQLIGSSEVTPNGIALQEDGSFLIANLGKGGGVWHLTPDGTLTPWLMEIEGRQLPGVNFVGNDAHGRIWICVSALDTGDHYPVDRPTGFILLKDERGLRMVADGLNYTNECRLTPDGRHLYVNETFSKTLTRFALAADGSLRDKTVIATFGAGDFPDGLALDEEGAAWVVCVGSNRLYRVARDGSAHAWIDDSIPEVARILEEAYVSRTITRPMLSQARGKQLKNITSIAFGGPDRRTAYMGCLAGDSLATFRAPAAGVQQPHWNWA